MNIKLKTSLSLFLVLLMVLSMPALLLKPAKAATQTLKILDPVAGDTSVTYTHAAPPPTASNYPLGYVIVNVSAFDVSNLAVWQINITWNPTLLRIENRAINGDMYVPTSNIFGNYPDPTESFITDSSAFWVVGIKSSGPPSVSGSGTLCQIKFNVTKTPSEGENLSCNIHFVLSGEDMFYTKLIDLDANLIDYTAEHGVYEYSWPPPPPPPSEGATFAVRPSQIINSSILPPQVIQVNITVKNVTDMYGYGFSLKYNPAILLCLSVSVLVVLDETNFVPEFSVNNTGGIVTVSVTYVPPAVPITTESEVPLVTITLRVKGIGVTPLHLDGTTLVDSLGRPIPHTIHDGVFANIIRDLAVTNVVTSANWVYQGNQRQINVTVKNQGEITETSVVVTVFYDTSFLANATIASLSPTEETTLPFTWNTAGVAPCHNYTISAEVTAVPYDMNVTNNVYSDGKIKVRWYGDVNGDDIVDGQDIALVKKAIPSLPSDDQWNPMADLNDDGVVDGVDLQRTKKKVGTGCPP